MCRLLWCGFCGAAACSAALLEREIAGSISDDQTSTFHIVGPAFKKAVFACLASDIKQKQSAFCFCFALRWPRPNCQNIQKQHQYKIKNDQPTNEAKCDKS